MANSTLEQLGHKVKEEELIKVSAKAAGNEAATWAAKCADEKHQFPSRSLCCSVSIALQCQWAVKIEMEGNILNINIPLVEAGHDGRLRVFKDAAYYALTDEDVLNTEEPALRLYLLGIFRAQCRLIKFLAAANVLSEFEQCVFCTATRDPVIQRHLGLSMTESIFDK